MLPRDIARPGTALRRQMEAAAEIAATQSSDTGQRTLVDDKATLKELSLAFESLGRHRPDMMEFDVVERYCALREPEWVVPCGYLFAAHLPTSWADSSEVVDLLFPPAAGLRGLVWSERSKLRESDIIAALDLADRLGLFGEMLERLCALSDTGGEQILEIRQRVRAGSRSRLFS